MKISLLSADLSSNCLGRTYILARILQRRYRVEIVGPTFGDGLWNPLAEEREITFKTVKIIGRFSPYRQLQQLTDQIEGDVLYANKPLLSSFGLALWRRGRGKKPLVLDIDDWELGLARAGRRNLPPRRRRKSCLTDLLFLYRAASIYNCLLGERLIRRADAVTVSNHFLQRRFGGVLVPHARDTEALNPARFDAEKSRNEFGIPITSKVVLFFGTPRPHKGVEDLIRAFALLRDPRLNLLVAGLDRSAYCRRIRQAGRERLGDKFLTLNRLPFRSRGKILSLADLAVIPQRDDPAGRGQLPAKVFDAMAMAKPIIATRVSDLPEILRDCGRLVAPGEPPELARAIADVLSNPEEAEEMGARARQRCIEKYSYQAMEKVLTGIFSRYE